MRLLVLLALCATACGGDDDSPSVDAPTGGGSDAALDDASVDAPPSGFRLTSTAFPQSGSIPGAHTCTGDGTSPPLAWAEPPGGTLSYALVLTDLTSNGLHWVIWDIPMATTSLPEDVDNVFEPPDVAGARQAPSFGNVRGYVGPCPNVPEEHMYQFALFALDVAALPNTNMNTTQVQALQLINQHRLASATLTGRYKQ